MGNVVAAGNGRDNLRAPTRTWPSRSSAAEAIGVAWSLVFGGSALPWSALMTRLRTAARRCRRELGQRAGMTLADAPGCWPRPRP